MDNNTTTYESLSSEVGDMLMHSIYTRSYNELLAKELNKTKAIFINQIHYWTTVLRNEEHYHEGRYWVYESYKSWQKQFPSMTARQIQNILISLEEDGYIYVGNFNKKDYDKTKWYAVNYDKVKETLLKQGQKTEDAVKPYEKISSPPYEKISIPPYEKSSSPIPNISIPKKSLPNNQKKINGAFRENALPVLDNNHIEDIHAYIAKTRERILSWNEVSDYADELCQALEHYYYRYWNAKKETHPPYSPSNMRKVCEVFVNYLGNNGILDMIDKYFETESMKENSDLRMLHFISDGITQNRAYETGQLDAIPHREFD